MRRRGASSRTRCALVPPNPNELTPAMAGPPVSGPGFEAALDSKRQGIEGDVGIRLEKLQARGDRPVVQGQGRLDQPGDPGRGLEVADVGLDRAEGTSSSGVASLGEHGPERGELDRIAERRAGAVSFDIIDLLGRDAGLPVGRAEDRFLRRSAGGRQAVGPSVLVDRAAADHRVDRVAVGQGARERLEHHHPRALAADITVGLRVEGLATPVRREEPGSWRSWRRPRAGGSGSRRPPSPDRIRRPRGSGRRDGPPRARTNRRCRSPGSGRGSRSSARSGWPRCWPHIPVMR